MRVLEVTVWDYVRYGANDFLGEVLLELNVCPLDDEPEWYYLVAHEEIVMPMQTVSILLQLRESDKFFM